MSKEPIDPRVLHVIHALLAASAIGSITDSYVNLGSELGWHAVLVAMIEPQAITGIAVLLWIVVYCVRSCGRGPPRSRRRKPRTLSQVKKTNRLTG